MSGDRTAGPGSPCADDVVVLLAGTPRAGTPARPGPASVEEQARVFAAVLDVAADAVIITEAEPWAEPGPRIVYANPAFTQHTGWTLQEVLGRSPRMLQGPGTDRQTLDEVREALARWRPVQVELLNYRKDGSSFWTELSIVPLADETGWYTHWVSVQRDITQRKHREHNTQRELSLARGILSSLPARTAVLDATGRILAVNAAWERFWAENGGVGPGGDVGADYLAVCEQAGGECDGQALRTAQGIRAVMAGARPSYTQDYECSSPNERRWYQLQVVPIEPDLEGTGARRVLVSHNDITAHKQGELALAHKALHDPLTGLANRALLLSRLGDMLVTCRAAETVALLFLDLDGFKSVNDSLGHPAGDGLLRVAAARLRAAAREQDLVGRLGGDEFLVCCPGVDAERAKGIGERLAEALRRPLQVDGLDLQLSVSTGVAVGDAGSTPDDLLRDADAAMYRAKALGRGRVEVFTEDLRGQAHRRLQVAAGLRAALAQDHLVLHFQPIVELATGCVVEYEALLRWEQADGVLLSPADFLDVAADTSMMVEIGQRVLELACAQAARWRSAGTSVPIAVNVAPEQLREGGLLEAVTGALSRHGLPADALVLEVTEQGVLDDESVALEVLSALRDVGVRIALDDFGTGFSSLSHLARLPVDVIKVDRHFVAGSSPAHAAIVRAVASLGQALDLDVVAEGIETEAQAAFVLAVGCTHGQGWLYGRAVPAEPLLAPPAVPVPRQVPPARLAALPPAVLPKRSIA